MFIGVVVFAGVCVVFLLGGIIYECVRDKDGAILTDYAHGRIAATVLGGIVLWGLALLLVFVADAVWLAPQFPGRSVYAVAVDLALRPRLYAAQPVWTAPALAAAGLAFAPLLVAAVHGLPVFRHVFRGHDGDYCAADADALDAEDFCCLCAPLRRRCGRRVAQARAAALAASASAASAPRFGSVGDARSPREWATAGVLLDYCFTACVAHFCVTCLCCLAAPLSDDTHYVWPWWAALAGAFVGATAATLWLCRRLALLEMPSERARSERRQRWRARHGLVAGDDYDRLLAEELGLVAICDVPPTAGAPARPVEMVPVTELKAHPAPVGTTTKTTTATKDDKNSTSTASQSSIPDDSSAYSVSSTTTPSSSSSPSPSSSSSSSSSSSTTPSPKPNVSSLSYLTSLSSSNSTNNSTNNRHG